MCGGAAETGEESARQHSNRRNRLIFGHCTFLTFCCSQCGALSSHLAALMASKMFGRLVEAEVILAIFAVAMKLAMDIRSA